MFAFAHRVVDLHVLVHGHEWACLVESPAVFWLSLSCLLRLLTVQSNVARFMLCWRVVIVVLALMLQDAMYAPYDAEIDFLQDQISVLSDEIAERDKHIESLKSERASVGYEAAGGRASRASSTTAPSDDGDRDVELQASTVSATQALYGMLQVEARIICECSCIVHGCLLLVGMVLGHSL